MSKPKTKRKRKRKRKPKSWAQSILNLPSATFAEFLKRVEQFISVARGRIDVKSRLMLLLNPDKPQTSTTLTKSQVQFVTICHFVAREFPVFKPLKEYADELCLTSISLEGKGIESAIRFTGALAESKLLQRLGVLQKEAKD